MFGENTAAQFRERFQLGLTTAAVDAYMERLIVASIGSNWTRLYDSFQYYSYVLLCVSNADILDKGCSDDLISALSSLQSRATIVCILHCPSLLLSQGSAEDPHFSSCLHGSPETLLACSVTCWRMSRLAYWPLKWFGATSCKTRVDLSSRPC